METPFVFGKIASDKNFTDRKDETERLVSNFMSSVNTILISPRRWGKSSLVAKAAEITSKRNKTIRFCLIDLNNVRTEEQFYQQLATKVLNASATKTRILLANARKFLGKFIPNITISPDPATELKLGLDWKEVKKEPDDILNLAEKISIENNFKFVICIDEFQNISEFENPLDLQKKMRSHWQKHKNVSYCLYGSKRHMLMDVFTSPSMPFYKFGDIIFLNKISLHDWISFIQKRFADSGKKIGNNEAGLIAELTDCHPYYVQQLAQQSWLRTENVCTKPVIEEAFHDLVLQLSMLFQNLTDGLNRTQLGLLKALTDKVEQLSSQRTILDYQLGTSANVVKIKKTLINKEIIDFQGSDISFLDPLYKYWLMEYYFKG
jgi:AAA+ ATPase superfamily predicted ATPase